MAAGREPCGDHREGKRVGAELPNPVPEPWGPNCCTFCQPRRARLPQGLQDAAGNPLMLSTILAVACFEHRLLTGLPGWQSLQDIHTMQCCCRGRTTEVPHFTCHKP